MTNPNLQPLAEDFALAAQVPDSARYFVHDPAVIFADEATGNLDSQTSDEIINLLLNLNAERGVTMLLVTHDSEIAERCSRVLVMQDGLIVEDRRTEEEE